jgi:predicted ATP-dependent protease
MGLPLHRSLHIDKVPKRQATAKRHVIEDRMSRSTNLNRLFRFFKRGNGDGGSSRSNVVPIDKLRRAVDANRLGFQSTADLDPALGLIGQERAQKAIQFGVSIKQPDFNLFVIGPPESGKSTAVQAYLDTKVSAEASPSDWIYVNNFKDSDKPKAIALPQGRAEPFAKAVLAAIDELKITVPALFEGDDYQLRHRAIDEEFRGQQEKALEALSEKAKGEGIAVLRTPTGFAMAPLHEGKVIKPEVFEGLTEEARKAIEAKIETLQKELTDVLEQMPRMQKDHRTRIQALNEQVADNAMREAIADVEQGFADLPTIVEHLAAVKADLIRNVAIFVSSGEEQEQMVNRVVETARDARFRRYLVNVMVANGKHGPGAPVIEENNPTHANLMGRVEHIAQMGALVTDFLLIKPGSLHQANGGYLLIDARKLLTSPYAWEALKRALKSRTIEIETPMESIGLISTKSLTPDPIPLNIKVILFGDARLYYMLAQYEPDFPRLFKVQADFDDTIDHVDANHLQYGRLIASICKLHGLKPVDAGGVARLIEEGSRLAEDSEKLSIEIGKLADIVREADHYAGEAGGSLITRAHIASAIDEQTQRADRARDKSEESFARDIILLDTSGAKVGQINGLSVLSLGTFAFGRPSRITARVRLGSGRVTDIERETEMGGPSHSKGVMILWGFLAGRYAQDVPLALSASLSFEQSYGGVDGDSASSTELYALLSALSGVPIKQCFAVTGSVNQLGEVQAIGGANQKIEGYFDVCRMRGLDGTQGVLIPKSNVQHLMLREDVVEAVRAGKFTIHAVGTIDDGIEILTGMAAGERGKDGAFPKDTINRLVEDRLRSFAESARNFAGGKSKEATV